MSIWVKILFYFEITKFYGVKDAVKFALSKYYSNKY